MTIDQLSVFVENRKGHLLEAAECLTAGGVDIRALSLADTADYGILRLVVDDPAKAMECLRAAGMTARLTKVLAVRMPDEPGGLCRILEVLGGADIGIEYAYAFVARQAKAAVAVLRVSDDAAASAALEGANISLLSPEDMAAL